MDQIIFIFGIIFFLALTIALSVLTFYAFNNDKSLGEKIGFTIGAVVSLFMIIILLIFYRRETEVTTAIGAGDTFKKALEKLIIAARETRVAAEIKSEEARNKALKTEDEKDMEEKEVSKRELQEAVKAEAAVARLKTVVEVEAKRAKEVEKFKERRAKAVERINILKEEAEREGTPEAAEALRKAEEGLRKAKEFNKLIYY